MSSPYLRKQPAAARRVSGHLRSRMCLSLGADLDQLLQEGGGGGGGGSEAARLNRLNLISSSLSLHRGPSSSSLSSCSTPPRYHSLGDLVEERRGRRSNRPTACARAHGEDESKQVRTCSLVETSPSIKTCCLYKCQEEEEEAFLPSTHIV